MLGKTAAPPNGRVAQGTTGVAASPRARMHPRRTFVLIAALALVIAAVAAALVLRSRTAPEAYRTIAVVRQDLAQTVTASGTVNPQNTILVGTQVSGTIQSIYVDYNSRVRKGQILARIDPSQFRAQYDQAQAALAQARAQAGTAVQNADASRFAAGAAASTALAQASNARGTAAAVAAADADVVKAQSALRLAEQTMARDRALLAHGFIARSQYDADATALISAQTSLRASRASRAQSAETAASSLRQAQAGSAQQAQSASQAAGSRSAAVAASAAERGARATLEQDALNLERTIITSPVDGTVVARNISVGQTVAASFQTPTLFTIAQDLKKMEIWIAVGEPDIGNVRPGSPANFTVLAYPAKTFHGTVSQVRVNPTTVQNVVTYTVIVRVDNPEGKLLPGMTANATITIAQAKNALVVPTQALTYRPQDAQSNAGSRRQPRTSPDSPWGQTAGTAGPLIPGSRGVVYVLRGGTPRAVPVTIGLVNGSQAAVVPRSVSLAAGDEVIVADSAASARAANTANPPPGFGRIIH